MIICIDPGHGGTDSGAVNGSRKESADNLWLAVLVQAILTAQGHTVIMTRASDDYVSLAARTNAANAAKADMFISLHRNAHTTAAANGVEIWVYTNPTAAETSAACEVLERLAAVGIQSNRGVKTGNYHVCRETKMPAMLIELGFISNAKDNKLFDDNLDTYAMAIAKGVLAALGVAYKEAAQPPQKPLYRVQVGAFSVKENAEAFLSTVRDMGLSAFLVAPDTAKEE